MKYLITNPRQIHRELNPVTCLFVTQNCGFYPENAAKT